MLEWPILRQFSSPCLIVQYLDSFSICSICLTVFRPRPHHSHWHCYRIWWLSPPHWTMFEWPILRQFSSPCSIVQYLDSFLICSICSICSTVFRPRPHHSHWRCYRIWWLSLPHWTILHLKTSIHWGNILTKGSLPPIPGKLSHSE